MREELNYEPFWVEVAEALRSTLLNTNILQGIHVQLNPFKNVGSLVSKLRRRTKHAACCFPSGPEVFTGMCSAYEPAAPAATPAAPTVPPCSNFSAA
jgi:hypothetical protein